MHRMIGCMLRVGSRDQSLHSRFDTSQLDMPLLKGIGAGCGINHGQSDGRTLIWKDKTRTLASNAILQVVTDKGTQRDLASLQLSKLGN